ncbi:MAG TPA: RIO1 family regulatory kinase/ATPase [Abditibacteriaceae bacterium]|jgi:predicted Ser/Thr protein kinase
MQSMENLTRADIAPHTVRVLRAGKGVQSSVYLVEKNGARAAVKDYSAVRGAFRILAPWLLAREAKAMRALQGVAGIPRFYGRPDRFSLAMEYIEGTPLDTFHKGELAPEVFIEAQKTIDAMHERGVAHGDLKRRSNLLLTPTGEIYLIDFAASLVTGKFSPIKNWLQTQVALVDDKSVPRTKKFVAPELLTDDDRLKLETPTALEKWARKLLNR